MTDQQDKVGRGQRVAEEGRIKTAPDGKSKVTAPPFVGELPADMTSERGAAPATTEDVTHVAETPSAWEAIEDDHKTPTTPPRRGRDPVRTQDKAKH